MKTCSNDCVVGLGSNLGDRRQILRRAVRLLSAYEQVTAVSSLYESPAVGPVQPHYLNAAVRLGTSKPALELLVELLGIERAFGRRRRQRWGPRTLDLDILWIAGVAIETPQLTVPHAHLVERPFALGPLLDVARDARDPRSGQSYQALVSSMAYPVVKVADPEWCKSTPAWGMATAETTR